MLAQSNALRYEATAIKQPTKHGIRIISEMGTWRILWYLAKRHKVGLLASLAFLGFTYNSLLPFAGRELFHFLFR